MGLTIKETMIGRAEWTQGLISESLISLIFNFAGESNAVKFAVVCAPTDTSKHRRER